jgi:hypothetical protein
MKTKSTLGEVATILLAGVAVVALAGWLGPKVMPSFFDKRTKQAEQSAAASAAVEARVAAERAAQEKAAATVSASLNQIGVANSQAPDSPQKTFIGRELVWLSPLLPPPDAAALLAAERRRVAILEGKLELADKLYATANRDRADLLTRVAKADARAEAAFAGRRAVDTQLAESAAYARGKDAVIGLLFAVAVLSVVLWLYTKFTTLGRVDIARMANRARETGGNIVDAIDHVVPDAWHDGIDRLATKLREKEAAKVGARKAAAEV